MAEIGSGSGTSYPSGIDTDSSIEVNSPSASKTRARAEVVNDLAAAIVAIETELGTSPSGTLADVKTYLQTEHGIDGTHNTTKVVTLTATQTLTNKTMNGQVKQTLITQTGAVATGSTQIPSDDTIPQNTEGDEYMTLAITPNNANNILLITITANFTKATNAGVAAVALFQDTTAGALAVAMQNVAAGSPACVTFAHRMVTGTVSATTFKVRIGTSTAGVLTFNGSAGVRLYGGVLASSIRIDEVVA